MKNWHKLAGNMFLSIGKTSISAAQRQLGKGAENALWQALHLEKTAYYELGRIGFPSCVPGLLIRNSRW